MPVIGVRLEEDWSNKVRDEEVFCPLYGHTAPAEQWFTKEQVEASQTIARR
jgi:hypothetical protein